MTRMNGGPLCAKQLRDPDTLEAHHEAHQVTGLEIAVTGCRYSADENHYQPRCVSCHRLFDGITVVRKAA